jgi:Large-conductance mechanosensitive channel, MscL
LLDGIDFSGLSYKIGKADVKYGMLIQTVFDFLIIIFSIFLFMKVLNNCIALKNRKKKVSSASLNKTRGTSYGNFRFVEKAATGKRITQCYNGVFPSVKGTGSVFWRTATGTVHQDNVKPQTA